jgi:hypothetical protein
LVGFVNATSPNIMSEFRQSRLLEIITEAPRVVQQRMDEIYPEVREGVVNVALSGNEELFC